MSEQSPRTVLGQSSVRAESARTRGGSVKYCLKDGEDDEPTDESYEDY